MAKPQSLREEKPRASQTVGRCLKIQIQRTKGEALSARWGIGAWQANVSKIGEQKKKKRKEEEKKGEHIVARGCFGKRIGSLWVPTSRGSTSKLAGGRSFCRNSSPWIYSLRVRWFLSAKNYGPP